MVDRREDSRPLSSCTRSQPILTALVGQGTLASSGRVIEIKPVEFILVRVGDRKIAVGPPIGRGENFLVNRPRLSINRPVLPSLADRLADIALG